MKAALPFAAPLLPSEHFLPGQVRLDEGSGKMLREANLEPLPGQDIEAPKALYFI